MYTLAWQHVLLCIGVHRATSSLHGLPRYLLPLPFPFKASLFGNEASSTLQRGFSRSSHHKASLGGPVHNIFPFIGTSSLTSLERIGKIATKMHVHVSCECVYDNLNLLPHQCKTLALHNGEVIGTIDTQSESENKTDISRLLIYIRHILRC